MRLNEAQWVWMSLIESDWVWLSLIESEWVWMSLNESESQIRHKRLIKSSSIILLHDRSRKYWREHSQKSHTNEKSHASERLWSESHFRLVSAAFLVSWFLINSNVVWNFCQKFSDCKYLCSRVPKVWKISKLFTGLNTPFFCKLNVNVGSFNKLFSLV